MSARPHPDRATGSHGPGDAISTAPYVSDRFFEREQSIWRDAWLALGRESDVAGPGDFFSFEVKVVNAAILVVRGSDGVLRAFHNVCPHRGARVACAAQGRGARSFVCGFHGWAFDLEGRLRALPEPQLFPGLDAGVAPGLRAVAIDTWGGFVFVNLNPRPAVGLREYLHGLPATLGDYLGAQPWTWYTGYQRRFAANWKDLMNIQHEGYHASALHQRTLGARFAVADCRTRAFPDSPGVCSLLTVLRPEPAAGVTPAATAVQRASMRYGRTSNWVAHDTSGASQRFPGAVNQRNSDRWVFDCYTLFPNFMIFVGEDVLSIMRVWPVSAHTADWEWDWFFKDELRTFGELFNREHGRIATRNALTEDWPMVEGVHANMRAGVFTETLIGTDMESSVRALHEKLLAHLNLDERSLRHEFG